MAYWVKDPALSLLWFRSLLCCGFDPCPRNVCVPRIWPIKKKKKAGTNFRKEMDCLGWAGGGGGWRDSASLHVLRAELGAGQGWTLM